MSFRFPTRRGFAPLALALVAAFAVACGSGSDPLIGVFIDSQVQGLRYVGPNHSGVTNAAGEYDYEPGDEVCFFIDDIALGCATGNGIVTPIDLFDDADPNDDGVINVVRLLLSLDADGDPANGIDVSAITTTPEDVDGIDFTQDPTTFGMNTDVTDLVTDQGHDGMVATPMDAQTHFEGSLDEQNVFAEQMIGQWTYSTFFGAMDEVDTVNITAAFLAEIEAESDAETVTFIVRETDGEVDIVCPHYGFDVTALHIIGYLNCMPDVPEMAPQGDGEFLYFRLDRIVAGTAYARTDLIGAWMLADDTESVMQFGLPTPQGEFVLLEDTMDLDEVNAQVSASGVVTFTMMEDIPGAVNAQGIVILQQTCAYTGQMNVEKDWIAGNATCSTTGEKPWSMSGNVPR